jgi:hypothetical protein
MPLAVYSACVILPFGRDGRMHMERQRVEAALIMLALVLLVLLAASVAHA